MESQAIAGIYDLLEIILEKLDRIERNQDKERISRAFAGAYNDTSHQPSDRLRARSELQSRNSYRCASTSQSSSRSIPSIVRNQTFESTPSNISSDIRPLTASNASKPTEDASSKDIQSQKDRICLENENNDIEQQEDSISLDRQVQEQQKHVDPSPVLGRKEKRKLQQQEHEEKQLQKSKKNKQEDKDDDAEHVSVQEMLFAEEMLSAEEEETFQEQPLTREEQPLTREQLLTREEESLQKKLEAILKKKEEARLIKKDNTLRREEDARIQKGQEDRLRKEQEDRLRKEQEDRLRKEEEERLQKREANAIPNDSSLQMIQQDTKEKAIQNDQDTLLEDEIALNSTARPYQNEKPVVVKAEKTKRRRELLVLTRRRRSMIVKKEQQATTQNNLDDLTICQSDFEGSSEIHQLVNFIKYQLKVHYTSVDDKRKKGTDIEGKTILIYKHMTRVTSQILKNRQHTLQNYSWDNISTDLQEEILTEIEYEVQGRYGNIGIVFNDCIDHWPSRIITKHVYPTFKTNKPLANMPIPIRGRGRPRKCSQPEPRKNSKREPRKNSKPGPRKSSNNPEPRKPVVEPNLDAGDDTIAD